MKTCIECFHQMDNLVEFCPECGSEQPYLSNITKQLHKNIDIETYISDYSLLMNQLSMELDIIQMETIKLSFKEIKLKIRVINNDAEYDISDMDNFSFKNLYEEIEKIEELRTNMYDKFTQFATRLEKIYIPYSNIFKKINFMLQEKYISPIEYTEVKFNMSDDMLDHSFHNKDWHKEFELLFDKFQTMISLSIKNSEKIMEYKECLFA